MAHAGVMTLKQILEQLLHTNQYPFNYPKSEIQPIYDEVCLLQSDLEEISIHAPRRWRRNEVPDLENQIREATSTAQDLIEFCISRIILSSESEDILVDCLGEIGQVLGPVGQRTREIRSSIRESIYKVDQELFHRDARDFAVYSPKINIVGQEEDLSLLKDKLLIATNELQVILISGLPGVGKTTLARNIYEDPAIRSSFDLLGWATVGMEYDAEEIISKLLDSSTGMREPKPRGHDELATCLYKSLYSRRYLIVMDDIWDAKLWDVVKSNFPDNGLGSRIVLTSRYPMVAHMFAKTSLYHHVMQTLDLENSWSLLCRLVFGGELCPPQLEKIGRKIAAKCKGLPLSIRVIGHLLSQGEMSKEFWEHIEDDLNAAAVATEESYLNILSLSYNTLPAKLKGCFLYMGGFPEDSEISVSKLIMLWIAEGFLTPLSPPESLEEIGMHCLNELVDRNFIQIRRISSDGQPKTCSLHVVMHLLAKEECRKQKFLLPITSSRYNGEGDDNESRRISIYENTLVYSEDFARFFKSATLARSFILAGSDHLYPNIPNFLSFKLLRVLDALAIYFAHFPLELIVLIHLRYLSLTNSGKLPPSISKLQNLQFLIVRRHPKFMYIYTLVLPQEIWNMPLLRHIHLTQIEFPNPCEEAQNSVFLENLQSLSNVDVASCTKEVLQSMPNLKKIGMWVEAPGCVDFHVDQLQQLEALKFTVMKPIPGEKIHFLPDLAFPKTLRKLSLSGCGIPWEDMTVVGELPCLQVVKLRNSAFQGPRWALEKGHFLKLEYLLLESLDLVHLDADDSHFPRLQRLIIRHCYELEEICTDIGYIYSMELIELVDCGPLAEDCAREIKDEQEIYDSSLQVCIYSSWK